MHNGGGENPPVDCGSLNGNGVEVSIFQTDGCGTGRADSKKLGFDATPALGPISTTEVTQKPLKPFAELNPRSVARRLSWTPRRPWNCP